MKIFLHLLLLNLAICVNAQTRKMIIHQGNDRSLYNVSEVDSITFMEIDDNPSESADMVDIDGNTYPTVSIGGFIWSAESLRTTHYNNGNEIPFFKKDSLENIGYGGYCHFDDNANTTEEYGAVYNWYAVNNGNLCPTGYHVPSRDEWIALVDYIASDGYDGREGDALKAVDGFYTKCDDCNPTDPYGFSAKAFNSTDLSVYFWSSTESSTTSAYEMPVNSLSKATLVREDWMHDNKTNALKVRCVKNY